MAFFLFVFALIFIGVFTAKSVKIVRQAEVMIIERLGKFDKILESGFQVIVPFIDTPRGINWKPERVHLRLSSPKRHYQRQCVHRDQRVDLFSNRQPEKCRLRDCQSARSNRKTYSDDFEKHYRRTRFGRNSRFSRHH